MREGIHVSDLVLCLREAYFRKVCPKPPSETQLMFFLDGARRHSALESLSDVRTEVEVEGMGVVGTVDMLGNCPIEFKSTRAAKALPDHYFKQLGYYAALTGSSQGILAVQRLNKRESPFEFYSVEYDAVDIDGLKRDMSVKRASLESALESNSTEGLPMTEESWKCENCLYRAECGVEKEAVQ